MGQNAVVKKESEVSIEQILHTAIQKDGFDVNALEKLIDMKERIDKVNAERAFNEAMNIFQTECEVVPRQTQVTDADAGGKKIYFKYASLEDIAPVIKEPLRKSGLSYSHKTETLEKTVKTTCIITHLLGHSKEFSFESQPDQGTSMMNVIQKASSTVSYGKRITLKMGFGLIEAGEDDDGNGAGEEVETITEAQETILTNLIGVKDSDKPLLMKILEFYKIESLSDVPQKLFEQCKNKINASKKAAAKL